MKLSLNPYCLIRRVKRRRARWGLVRHRTGLSGSSPALDPAGRAAQPCFPPALTATGAVAWPREPDVADQRIAVVERHNLSGIVPLEAQNHPGQLKRVSINRFEF